MKILQKVMIVLMIVLISMTVMANYSFAEDDATGGDSTGSGWKSTTQFDSHNDTNVDGKVQKIIGAALSVVRIVGTGMALIMIAAVAIKYMSAAPSERADIKKSAIIYVVGAVVLFAGANLVGLIQTFAGNI